MKHFKPTDKFDISNTNLILGGDITQTPSDNINGVISTMHENNLPHYNHHGVDGITLTWISDHLNKYIYEPIKTFIGTYLKPLIWLYILSNHEIFSNIKYIICQLFIYLGIILKFFKY